MKQSNLLNNQTILTIIQILKKKLTLINWSLVFLLYLLFSIWHGAFEGPLTPDEIEVFVNKYQALNPKKDTKRIKALMESDDGQAKYMVNDILYENTNRMTRKNQCTFIYIGFTKKLFKKFYSKFTVNETPGCKSYPSESSTTITVSESILIFKELLSLVNRVMLCGAEKVK